MKKTQIILAALIFSSATYSQQDAMYTHYAFNTLGVNPAYAGSRDVTTVTGLHRNQWVGFDGAPTTQSLTLHSPVFTDALGLGLSVINDKVGPLSIISLYGDISYRLKLTAKTKLAFGVKGGGNLMQGDFSDLESVQSEVTPNYLANSFLPNFGGGLYLYNEKWYLGLSAPKIIENGFTTTSVGSINGEKRHYFFIAGFVKQLSRTVKLKPTGYIKATEASPIEGDLTAMLIFKDKLELGAMYRTGDALGALIGFNFTSQLRAGYSFDWSFVNMTGKYNAGSHEVMLRYDIIGKTKDKIYSPRYF